MFDFNDAEPQMGPMGALIPDGTFAKVRLNIRPGGIDGPAPGDEGILRSSNTSDAKMLECEFVVVEGPHIRRKLWQSFCITGGKLDKKDGVSIGWKISKSTFRAMIESALNIDPKDMGDEAKKKRTLKNLSQLNGITFGARIMIEPSTDPKYKDQNRIANVLIRGDEQYDAVMRGETVEPEPVNAQPRKVATASPAAQQGSMAPAWGSSSAPVGNDTPAWLS